MSEAQKNYHFGNDCYAYVEKLIIEGKRIYIISPYVDAYYADFIMKNAGGKRIYIISSSIESEARKILSRSRYRKAFVSVSLFLLLFNLFSYLVHIYYMQMFLISLAAFVVASLAFSAEKHKIRLKTPKYFTHAKLYISDKAAIQGSANLTYNGMHKNVEHIESIYDQESIGSLRKEFLKIWHM